MPTTTYLLLQTPGHNRVYYDAAVPMALAELKLALNRMALEVLCVEERHLAGVRYFAFETARVLDKGELAFLSRLSFVFALFSAKEQAGPLLLKPLRKRAYERLNPKVGTLLKYPGKTNELFTKMMLHVAALASDFDPIAKLTVCDPVAGRGTTLFEAAVYGYDAFGIEKDPKAAHEAGIFFKKYLETERLKHRATKRQIAGKSKADAVYIQAFEYAESKAALQSEETTHQLGIVTGKAQAACEYFKKDRFHLIIGDLPYGIYHKASGDAKTTAKSRNPTGFLNEALPQWFQTLKPGGVVAVAWNTFVASRHQLATIFTAHGFAVCNAAPYNGFEHRVDQSIKRDILVARKNQKH